MSAPDENVTIATGGQTLGGWESVSITRGVEICPSSFDIQASERYPAQPTQAVVNPGAPCTVSIGGQPILTGYVDAYVPSYDADRHTVHIAGRSKTEDVVDCSVDVDQTGWEIFGGTSVLSVASKICAPYDVTVKMPDGDSPLPTGSEFSVYPGITGYALLEEMARAIGMLVWDDANGNLIIGKGGTGGRAATALVEGVNILSATAAFTMNERFQTYRVVSQIPNKITGHLNVAKDAIDNGVPRPRLKIIPTETPLFSTYPQLRADWERSRRYGRSRIARITVTGWRDGKGNLWTPNTMVSVEAPTLKLVGDRVISEVTWYRGDDGTFAILTLIELVGLQVEPFYAPSQLGDTSASTSAAGTIST